MDNKINFLQNPPPNKVEEVIQESLRQNNMSELFGKCEINYDGRASSYLGFGDRLIILKPDGVILVHKKEKREPVNWQPPGSRFSTHLDQENDLFILKSKRKNPDEELEIIFDEVYFVSSFKAKDNKELELDKSEEKMGDLLENKPWIIENGFKVIEREKETNLGYIDLFGEDKNGKKVIMELKRKKIGLSAVSQLNRYFNSLKSRYNDLRGIIVGPSLSEKAKNLLDKKELEFIELKPEACDLGTDLREYI